MQFKTDKTRSEERPAKCRYVLQLNCTLCRRLTEPPFLLNDLPKTEGDTTEKIEKEGQE